MPTPPDGAPGTLWHVNIKINADNKGYNAKFPIVTADPAVAKASGLAVATAYRRIMPGTAEIFYATVSNYNTKRDSRFLRDALGAGLFQEAAGPPIVSTYDASFTGIKLRLENSDGGSVTRIINPVPDAVLSNELIVPAIADLTATFVGADPAEGLLTDYVLQFGNFMKILSKHTVHQVSGSVPGGAFQYWPIVAAMPIGVSKKKGSRAFI